MRTKKKLLIALGVIFAVAFISGASILAATTLGTAADPLVTLSYLTSKLKPQIMNDVNASINAAEATLSAQLDTQVNDFTADIDARLNNSASQTAGFTLVTLAKDQTVVCGVGTEILLRVGTAAATGSGAALVDTTSGGALSSGGALTANHMYMVSIQGNGLKATASSVKILIRGTYMVS